MSAVLKATLVPLQMKIGHEQVTGRVFFSKKKKNYTYFSTGRVQGGSSPNQIFSTQFPGNRPSLPRIRPVHQPDGSTETIRQNIDNNSSTYLFERSISPRFHLLTFFEQIEDIIDLEADLIRVLAHVLVQGPAAWTLRFRLGFRGRKRPLTDAPFPLLPVTKTQHIFKNVEAKWKDKVNQGTPLCQSSPFMSFYIFKSRFVKSCEFLHVCC